jgi:hypothetical protein
MAAPEIAWEDSTLTRVVGLWRTVWSATTDPVGTFGRLGPDGHPREALLFSLVTSVIGWSPTLALMPCLGLFPLLFSRVMPEGVRAIGTGALCALAAIMPFVIVLGSVAVELVHGLVFHGLARMVGGVGSLSASMRAMLYTGAIRFWLWAAAALSILPFLAALAQSATRLAFVLWSGFACYGAARSVHGLADDRATLVAILTPLLSVLVVGVATAALVLAVLTVFAGSFGLAGLLSR